MKDQQMIFCYICFFYDLKNKWINKIKKIIIMFNGNFTIISCKYLLIEK